MEEANPMNGRPPNNGPQGPDQPAYTIPGILNFVKHEWTRFEKERANWDAEKTELQAKIAFLEGERRGQENLKRDLVRRIKMLEYALKQERIKLHKLQYGKDLVFSEMKPPNFDGESLAPVDPLTESSRNDSRQILRDCLREIGYTDALLDARASRIRHLRNITGLLSEPSDNTGVVTNNRQTRSEATEAEDTTHTNQLQQQQRQQQQQHQQKSEVSVLTSQDTVTSSKENDTGQEEPPASVVLTETTAKPSERPSSPPPHPVADEESLIAEAQESLEKSFEFLENQDDSDSDSGSSADDESDENSSSSSSSRHKKSESIETLALSPAETAVEHDLDHETEDAMLEFTSVSTHQESDFIETDMSSESGPDAPPSYHVAVASQEAKSKEQEWSKTEFAKIQEKYAQHVRRKKKPSARPCRTELQRMKQFKNNQDDEFSSFSPSSSGNKGKNSPELEPYSRPKSPKQATGNPRYEKIEQSLGLGELDGLTILNEADPVLGAEQSADEVQKTWFGRYTMRSHFDAVTSVAFHPTESMLLTGSEDKTLKLWNLQRNGQTRKTAMIDVEPVLTLRGHVGSVLCVGADMTGEVCFSADELGEVRIWQLPIEVNDPFDSYDPKIHQGVLKGHTDAVWDLVVHRDRDLLATCSSDGTCKIWNWKSSQDPLISLASDPDYGVPTSVDFVRSNPCQIVVSYVSSHAVLFDTETGKAVLELNSTLTSDNTTATQINKIRCHPTLPIAVTAHEDKYLRFYDLTSGAVTHSMVAHGDAVSGIAIDPNGLYLLSSSHDGSLRFWNLDTKICVQDSITHRRRFDEAIFNVACHACKPFFASAGADGIAKVFI